MEKQPVETTQIIEYGAHNPAPYGTIGGEPVRVCLFPGARTTPSAEPEQQK